MEGVIDRFVVGAKLAIESGVSLSRGLMLLQLLKFLDSLMELNYTVLTDVRRSLS